MAIANAQSSYPYLIEEAEKRHKRIFFIYIIGLVVTGLIVALLTWLFSDAGNKLQDAIRSDANTRIAGVESDSKGRIAKVESDARERIEQAKRESNEKIEGLKAEAEKAKEGIARAQADAAKANERAQNIERDNLTLRTSLATLEKDAAEAHIKQAQAEIMLANIAKRQNPRILDSKTFVEKLKGKPKARVEIMYQKDDPEPFGLAVQIRRWLGEGENGDGAGWNVAEPKPIGPEWIPPNVPTNMPLASSYMTIWGLSVITSKSWQGEQDSATGALIISLMASGISFIRMVNPKLPEDLFVIVIGPKL